ncbi:hypothetical protein [Agathobaculum butyriciproducens]|uniref:hypothetical protein n=1 Tax=Agathobaculum butyriciproducens TaxID=1628085 RepID=UPI0036D30F97
MQFYELNSSRMDYRELSADDLNLLTPLLRSEETMQTLGGALSSYEQTLDWLVDYAAPLSGRGLRLAART